MSFLMAGEWHCHVEEFVRVKTHAATAADSCPEHLLVVICAADIVRLYLSRALSQALSLSQRLT